MKIPRFFLAAGILLALSFVFSCCFFDDDKDELANELCKRKYGFNNEGAMYTNPTKGSQSDCKTYYMEACTETGLRKLVNIERSCGPQTTQREYSAWVECMDEKEEEYNTVLKSECPTLTNEFYF